MGTGVRALVWEGHGQGGHAGVEVESNTSQMALLCADSVSESQLPFCEMSRKEQSSKPVHSSSSPSSASEQQAPWAICFVKSTFAHPILAGVELLSPFIDEDTGAHWHPAFIYMVTTVDGWGEQGRRDYPQGHRVSVGGTRATSREEP